ncbi:MAG: 30S ribosomal protein S12 methylthiotransferase RimO [Candidatus Delongbacteria bacterium]|nr:30S ribosomal protein S12 methylthiotransferase RimO [Candidatus Delongbacteria bacterium]
MKTGKCKTYLETLGCPKNLTDSEDLIGRFPQPIVTEPDQADIIVLNTCAFIDDAVEESVNRILELSRFKTEGQLKTLIVHGCLVNRYGADELKSLLPEVDYFWPVRPWQELETWLREFTDETSSHPDGACHPDIRLTHPAFRYLKIAEGCNNACSYCLIPSIRGRLVSEPVESLYQKVQSYAAHKEIKEIILIAQDTANYGHDLDPPDHLVHLLQRLETSDFEGWFRLMYLNPSHITPALIDHLAGSRKIIPYLDIPIQHCNTQILKRMNRPYTRADLIDLYRRLHDALPGLVLRTTVMVGFPYETETRFEELLEFIQEYPFDKLGGFIFQPQSGTPAAGFPARRIARRMAEERLALLMGIQQEISHRRLKRFLHQDVDMVVMGSIPGKKYAWWGRTYRDAPEIDGITYLKSDGNYPVGTRIRVKIIRNSDYDAYAIPVD